MTDSSPTQGKPQSTSKKPAAKKPAAKKPAAKKPAVKQTIVIQEKMPSPQTTAQAAPKATAQAATSTQVNVFALVGFILSLVGIFTFVTSIVGVVLGHVSLKQIRQTQEQGHGMAVAALVIGYVTIGLWVLALVGFVLFTVLLFIVPSLIFMTNGTDVYYS